MCPALLLEVELQLAASGLGGLLEVTELLLRRGGPGSMYSGTAPILSWMKARSGNAASEPSSPPPVTATTIATTIAATSTAATP